MTLHTESILSITDYIPPKPMLADILRVVSAEYQIPLRVLEGRPRDKHAVRARFAFYYLAREYALRNSFSRIAERLSRNHATVMHGYYKAKQALQNYEPELSKCISELQRKSIPESGAAK